MMLGDQPATVTSVRAFDIHGMPMIDLEVRYADGSGGAARIGAESAPADLAEGDAVLVTHAANMIVSVRRA